MARKRSRRARKRARKKKRQERTTPRELLALGRQRLQAGDARGALDFFKQARHRDDRLEGLALLLSEAYALRARQLAAKGMEREAGAMRRSAEEHRAAIDPSALKDPDFVWYLDSLDLADAVCTYADALPVRGVSSSVERRLADRLVAVRCWDVLSALEGDHPLRRDAAHLREAIPAMDAGEWVRAGASLEGISRRSPFAPWRVFCRGMACWCAEDDEGLRRAVDMLPEDFALSGVVAEWRRTIAPPAEGDGTAGSKGAHALLWEGGANVEELGQELVAAVRARRFQDIEPLLVRLSKGLYPEGPEGMCATLLQILGIAGRDETLPLREVIRLTKRLLSAEQAQLTQAKIGLVAQKPSHEEWDVAPAARYLSLLKSEFPDARRQALARARVLEFLARSGHDGGACPYCVGPRVMGTLWSLIGERSDDSEMIFADLMMASLKADPDNREGYAFLLNLLRGRQSSRPQVEQALTEMAERFPEDAAPCLELAALHYSKNAYRKAERALEEAQRRAPYDDQVLDRQAIGYLKSADQNRNRGRRHLAEPDYDRAEAMGRRRVAPVLSLKRLGMEMITHGRGALKQVERHLKSLSPLEQLRSLTLLIHDLEWVDRVEAGVLDRLKRMLKGKRRAMKRLSSAEVVALMAPLEECFAILFEGLQVAEALSDFWDPLLARAEGDDLIALFDILLACAGQAAVRKEIDRRLSRTRQADRDPMLLFYLAAVRHMEQLDYGSRRFQEALDRVDEAQRERLRAAAARLAEFAHGPLEEALRRFDFSGLDVISPFGRLFGGLPAFLGGVEDGDEDEDEFYQDLYEDDEDFYEDEDEDEDDGDLYEEEEDVFDALDGLEEMIDKQGMRGAPVSMLRELAGMMRSDPQTRRDWDEIAQELEPVRDDISREAQALLFPKKRGRRRR